MNQHKSRKVLLRADLSFTGPEDPADGLLPAVVPGEDQTVGAVAQRVIEEELPRELRELYGLLATSNVVALRDGDRLVFFNASITGLGLHASYADFHAGIELVKTHASRMLAEALRPVAQPMGVRVDVETEFPSLPHPSQMSAAERIRDNTGVVVHTLRRKPKEARVSRRDGVFWWVLAMNVVLLLMLGFVAGTLLQQRSGVAVRGTVGPDNIVVPMHVHPQVSSPRQYSPESDDLR